MTVKRTVKRLVLTTLMLVAALAAVPARANPPVTDYPDLTYISVLHALTKLDKFKPDSQEYLEAYAMVAHCDVVKGSYRDEFRWNQARDAVKKWVAMNKKGFSTRLAVRSQVMFDRYDFASKTFLFSPDTEIKRVNVFQTDPRPDRDLDCNKPVVKLLPTRYRVVTNNPLTLPGLRLTESEAQDLSQKFNYQNNPRRIAWIRFNIDIIEADYMGPTVFSGQSQGDTPLKVKATLRSVEFFSDPQYKNRFYYYVPL